MILHTQHVEKFGCKLDGKAIFAKIGVVQPTEDFKLPSHGQLAVGYVSRASDDNICVESTTSTVKEKLQQVTGGNTAGGRRLLGGRSGLPTDGSMGCTAQMKAAFLAEVDDIVRKGIAKARFRIAETVLQELYNAKAAAAGG